MFRSIAFCFAISAMLTISRQASNIYWIITHRASGDAPVRASALMDLFGLGVLLTWLLPEDDVRAGGDRLEPSGLADTPLLQRFLGLHSPNSVFKRRARLGWWTWSTEWWPAECWEQASTAAAMRALAWLPLSDRVSKALTGWALRRGVLAWMLGFPFLAGGLALCLGVQLLAVALCTALYLVVALLLSIGNFSLYSDKKVALRCAGPASCDAMMIVVRAIRCGAFHDLVAASCPAAHSAFQPGLMTVFCLFFNLNQRRTLRWIYVCAGTLRTFHR